LPPACVRFILRNPARSRSDIQPMLCFVVIPRQGGQIWRWTTAVVLAFDGAHAPRLDGFFVLLWAGFL
jgi:hypothetical protein